MRALIVNDTKMEISEDDLQEQLKEVAKSLLLKNVIDSTAVDREVTLVFLDKLEAKKLNWQYRQKDYATDILSFESGDPESLGELVFCPEVLETQAKEHKQTFEQELGLMLIHGVLHLLGFDHEEGGDEEKKMMELQEKIFAEIFNSRKPSNGTKKNAKPNLKINSKEKSKETKTQAKQIPSEASPSDQKQKLSPGSKAKSKVKSNGKVQEKKSKPASGPKLKAKTGSRAEAKAPNKTKTKAAAI